MDIKREVSMNIKLQHLNITYQQFNMQQTPEVLRITATKIYPGNKTKYFPNIKHWCSPDIKDINVFWSSYTNFFLINKPWHSLCVRRKPSSAKRNFPQPTLTLLTSYPMKHFNVSISSECSVELSRQMDQCECVRTFKKVSSRHTHSVLTHQLNSWVCCYLFVWWFLGCKLWVL